jgi:hypothetical protein
VTSSGKKIGDVYYFSADKKTKLRSYVEMGLFLKRSSSGLAPENFTFARQPIYHPPQEIVRHAMQRGGGQHLLHPSQIIDSAPFTPAVVQEAPLTEPQPPSAQTSPLQRSARNSTASESEEQFSTSIAEGRAKRKRVAPTRFEDEDYSESPLKKKGHRERGPSGGERRGGRRREWECVGNGSEALFRRFGEQSAAFGTETAVKSSGKAKTTPTPTPATSARTDYEEGGARDAAKGRHCSGADT